MKSLQRINTLKSTKVFAAILVSAFGVLAAQGQDTFTWSGYVTPTPDSTTTASWNVPTTTVSIGSASGGLTGEMTLSGGAAATFGGLMLERGSLSLVNASLTVTGSAYSVIGTSTNSDATLTLDNSRMLVTSMHVGSNNGAVGAVIVSNASVLTSSSYFMVGNSSSGSLLITGSGSAVHAGEMRVGAYTDSTGAVTISNGAAFYCGWNASYQNFVVGSGGTGTFLVTGAGSTASIARLAIGGYPTLSGGTGVMTIAAGASLTISEYTEIGYTNGNGTLALEGGSANFGSTVSVGIRASGAGTLRASNATDEISIGQTLSIGANGTLAFNVDLNEPNDGSAIITADAISFDAAGGYIVDFTALAENIDTAILLLQVSGAVSDEMKQIAWEINGLDAAFGTATTEWIGNSLYLNVSTVPEPAAAAGLLSVLALALATRRRK